MHRSTNAACRSALLMVEPDASGTGRHLDSAIREAWRTDQAGRRPVAAVAVQRHPSTPHSHHEGGWAASGHSFARAWLAGALSSRLATSRGAFQCTLHPIAWHAGETGASTCCRTTAGVTPGVRARLRNPGGKV